MGALGWLFADDGEIAMSGASCLASLEVFEVVIVRRRSRPRATGFRCLARPTLCDQATVGGRFGRCRHPDKRNRQAAYLPLVRPEVPKGVISTHGCGHALQMDTYVLPALGLRQPPRGSFRMAALEPYIRWHQTFGIATGLMVGELYITDENGRPLPGQIGRRFR